MGHNRLRLEPDGTVTWFERNNTLEPTSPVDPTVSVLRLDTTGGTPIAVLVNYACHPVVFGADNLDNSADYPGVMTQVVERALGGQGLAMFLQGGDGDINPDHAVHPLDQDAVKMRDWTCHIESVIGITNGGIELGQFLRAGKHGLRHGFEQFG